MAAEIRARYRVSLLNALQIATAIQAHCDAFLTNDYDLKRIQELPVLIIEEISL